MGKPSTRGSTNPSSAHSSSNSSTPEDRREDRSCSEETERQGANRQGANRREANRLAALHRYGVLDTEEEAAFDRITQLVKRLLNVSTALVTFVDEERLWLKSCAGREQPGREQPGREQPGREQHGIPREVAFCNHNIRSEGVMVVEDATADPRFADNPLVTGPPHIRFYAGAPLVTEDGYALGSLCVIDTEPRSLAAGERATLETLAAVVVDAMTLRTHYTREHEILESIGDGFIALDADWRLTYVNKQAEDALRRGREDLLGQSLWEMFPEAKGTMFDETFHRVAETGEAAEFEAYFSPLQTWLRVKAHPVEHGASKGSSRSSSKGPSQGLSVYFDDITQQKEDQERLRMLSQAVDDMEEAVIITDSQLDPPGPHIEYVNPAFTEMTGYTEEEVLGRAPRLLQGEATDRDVLLGVRRQLNAGQASKAEVVNYRKDGTPYDVQWSISPVRGEDGTIQHWVSVQRDVTEQRKRERDLRQTRKLLDSIIESAGVGICVTGADGRFVRVNPAYVDTYGWSREELIGEPFTKVLPPADRAGGMAAHDRFIYNRIDEIPSEWRVQRKDGTLRSVIVTAGRIEQDREKQDGGEQDVEPMKVTTVTDITERKQAEEALHAERDLLESIFNTSAAGIVVLGSDGAIVRANERAREVLAAPHDIRGRMYTDPDWQITTVTGEPFPEDEAPFVRVMETEAPVYDVRCAAHGPESDSPEGRRRILSVNGAPLHETDGSLAGGVFTVRDVTEEVETQQQLIDAKEEAESASRLKSAMLANMSHEVRTPLTSIIGFTEVLADELSGTHRQFVDQIYRSGQRLELTLTSVLQLSKLEADLEALDAEAFDVAGELDEAARALAPEAQEADVDLQVYASERPLRIVSDRNAFYRIIMNLACNAIKFTEAGGRVELRITREGHQVILRVKDTGVGISDAFQARMYEAFTQESSGIRREHEGSGLGLAIVRRLVDLLGGAIDVESIKGKGTTFEVALPATRSTENA